MDDQMPKRTTDRSSQEVNGHDRNVPQGPPPLDQQFVIQALIEENRTLNENKLYLVALIKQLQAEHAQAEVVWEAERESLMAGKAEGDSGD